MTRSGMSSTYMFQFMLVPILAFGSFVAPCGQLISGHDCTKYALELFLAPPETRSIESILFSFIIRLVVVVLVCLESFRSVAFFYGLTIIINDRICSFVTKLMKCTRFLLYYRYYTQLHIIFKSIAGSAESVFYIIFTALFWATVVLVGVCMKFKPQDISIIYWWFLMMLVVVLAGCYIGLSVVCKQMEMSVNIPLVQYSRVRLRYSRLQTTVNKIDCLKARSVQSIKIKFGLSGYFGKDVFTDYYYNLCLRSFDVILIL